MKSKPLTLKQIFASILIVFSLVLPFHEDRLLEDVEVLDLVKITLIEGIKLLDDGKDKESKK